MPEQGPYSDSVRSVRTRPLAIALALVPLSVLVIAGISFFQINDLTVQQDRQSAAAIVMASRGAKTGEVVRLLRSAGFSDARVLIAGAGEELITLPLTSPEGIRIGVVTMSPKMPIVTTFTSSGPIKLTIIGATMLVALYQVVRVLRRMRRAELHRIKAQQLAMTDVLSGLGNRGRFFQRLEAELAVTQPMGDYQLVLCLIDIDRFKGVNDTYGHAAGDAVIQSVARDLTRLAAPQDLVARIGGDEFAMIRRMPRSAAAVEAFADRLAAALRHGVAFEGNDIATTSSIGVAVADPTDILDAAVLRRNADLALYAAKHAGRGQAHLFGHGSSIYAA